jgi:hypothetical protein
LTELSSPPAPRVGGVRDLFLLLAAAGVAGALYLLTLQPDFGGPEDTPKFQFVGYVLGIPHAPGYPLYVLLSHVFVTLVRVGTIAYRANLFSAAMAVVASMTVVVIARALGSSRWPALCAAVALAAGVSFWRSAVFAEVYSLAAAVAGLSMALLLLWGERQRPALLLGAVAATAAAFGNHLTIVGVVPAYVLYVLWRNPRAVMGRYAIAAALLIALGVAQYGLIILRTRQHAPYLETAASDVGGLVDVILARRFADKRFSYGWNELLSVLLPVVTKTVAQELGIAGIALFVPGLLSALARSRSGALAVAGAAAGMLLVIVNIGGDVRGFITPLMVFVWPFAACGADVIGRLAAKLSHRPGFGVLAAAAAAMIMPAVNVAANYAAADQSRETEAAETFRAVHRQLPDGSGLVVEDYYYDMAFRYYQLTGEGGGARHLRRVPFAGDAVRDFVAPQPEGPASPAPSVFAFGGAVTYLATEGARFVPFELEGVPLGQWLAGIPSGSLVVGATAYVGGPADLTPLGHGGARPPGRPQNFETFAVVAGRKGQSWGKHQSASSTVVDATTLGAAVPPFGGTLRALADEQGARIVIGDRPIVTAAGGLVLAVFAADGALARALDLGVREPWRVPLSAAVYRYAGQSPCVTVTSEWTDVSPVLAAGSAVTTLLRTGHVILETVFDRSDVSLTTAGIMGDAVAGGGRAAPPSTGTAAWRSDLSRTGGRRTVFRFALDAAAAGARARVNGDWPGGIALCAFPPMPLFRGGGSSEAIPAAFDHESYFGAGWSRAEMADTGRVRLAGERAAVLLPLERGSVYRLVMELSGPAGLQTTVMVGGQTLAQCQLAERTTCAVDLSPDDAPATAVTLVTPSAPAGSVIFRSARIERTR